MKKRMLVLIVLSFALVACVGANRLTVKQCKEITSTEKECMTFEVEGKSDLLSF